MSWFWRTKPRSIIKTIQWFPAFAALEGQNWDKTAEKNSCFHQKKMYPTRRTYIYSAHREEDVWLSELSYNEYLSGSLDQKETESNGRNDKTTYEFFGFGFVEKDGNIHITEAGKKILQGQYDQEYFLKQLLKLHLPNQIQSIGTIPDDSGIFPLELVLKAFSVFPSLNRSELALLFGCDCKSKEPAMLNAISAFKSAYAQLEHKNNKKKVQELFTQIYETYYGTMENKANTFYDYAEALSRSLVYTGLFTLSGRSIATKLQIPIHARKKVQLLQQQYNFCYPGNFPTISAYMDWYGNPNNVTLPWEQQKERSELIQLKLDHLQQLIHTENKSSSPQYSFLTQDDLNQIARKTKSSSFSDLKEIENTIDSAITSYNEQYFIHVSSKTETEQTAILHKFSDIVSSDDMSALWLEVNTWKSLVAISGTQQVKRNFKIEEDLTPRSFAPGVGNTPDMELYYNNIILLPEVSLMTGVRQWEHEGSSVIDHVMHFMQKYPQKQVLGLFLSSKLHIRTLWQFFLLCKESWLGKPIPVLPFTIEQYKRLITFCYRTETDISVFLEFLFSLLSDTRNLDCYDKWENKITEQISIFTSRH